MAMTTTGTFEEKLREIARARRVLQVPCMTCHAFPGEPCRDDRGARHPHDLREKLAEVVG